MKLSQFVAYAVVFYHSVYASSQLRQRTRLCSWQHEISQVEQRHFVFRSVERGQSIQRFCPGAGCSGAGAG